MTSGPYIICTTACPPYRAQTPYSAHSRYPCIIPAHIASCAQYHGRPQLSTGTVQNSDIVTCDCFLSLEPRFFNVSSSSITPYRTALYLGLTVPRLVVCVLLVLVDHVRQTCSSHWRHSLPELRLLFSQNISLSSIVF